MEREYLVTWIDTNLQTNVEVITLTVPPHDSPKGAVLDELARISLSVTPFLGRLVSVQELPAACWSPGAYRDLSLGDGRVATLECRSADGWRVHV